MTTPRYTLAALLFSSALLFATWGADHSDGRLLVAAALFVAGMGALGLFSETSATLEERERHAANRERLDAALHEAETQEMPTRAPASRVQ